MIVIGGKKSSNTLKLKNVCDKFCKSILIESANDLPTNLPTSLQNIGITAGASTPDYVISEVKQKIEEIFNGIESN